MKVKEDTREEMLRAHEWELESRDYLIQLLKEKVRYLQQQLQRNLPMSSSKDLTREARDINNAVIRPVFDVSHNTQH